MEKHFYNLFATHDLRPQLPGVLRALEAGIENEEENVLLQGDEREYLNYIRNKVCYPEPMVVISFDDLTAEGYEDITTGTGFIPTDDEGRPRLEEKEVKVICRLPYSGNNSFLYMYVDETVLQEEPIMVYFDEGFIYYEVVLDMEDPKKTDAEISAMKERIRARYSGFTEALIQYNEKLMERARMFYARRKAFLVRKVRALSKLSVPVLRNENTPSTFSIPAPPLRKKIEIIKPSPNARLEIDPALSGSIYKDIVGVLYDGGKVFERYPSTRLGKKEEDLRDLLLFLLQPHFRGDVYGEVFSKHGRTDIFLTYEKEPVFIAECKFWKGRKSYVKTIDQLLGYLTYHDSKTAVIIFVKDKAIQNVLEQITPVTEEHGNFLRNEGRCKENWFDFVLHLPGDRAREVFLSTLVFHIPD